MTWVAASLMIVLLWIFLRPKETPKSRYPTIDDIRRKYPKRLTQEQLRRQARAKDELKNSEPPSLPERDNHPRYWELVRLLNGNRETADRLSNAYGVDKAIADLERDRRFN
jgi:hypothetical protein